MNKYLEIAQKVLADSESMLTARQIWGYALKKGYASSDAFGKYPWLALGRALSREINQHEHLTTFGFTPGRPTYYFMLATLAESDLWVWLEDEADAAEDLGMEALLIYIRSRKPATKLATTKIHNRDPKVVAYVRLRAGHCCELCNTPRFPKDNGKQYVEVHHLKRLADGGSDIPENAVALCANCHRMLHQSKDRGLLLNKLIMELTARGIQINHSDNSPLRAWDNAGYKHVYYL